MIALVVRGIAARRLRSALTMVAILLGVAMVAGTYVQTDQIRTAFADIEEAGNAGNDAVITARSAFDSSFMTPEPFDEAVLELVRGTDGVAAAEGSIFESGALVVEGETISSDFAPTLVAALTGPPFSPLTVREGRLPDRPGEIVVDRATASDQGLRPGQRVDLTTRSGTQPVVISGVVVFGDDVDFGGATLVGAALADVQRWFLREGKVTQIVVAASENVGPDELARRLRAVLPADLEVRTGDQAAAEDAETSGDAIGGFLTPALLAFAGAALLVGAFIIFNTFSITVAQRTREFALLRAIGATRGQILGATAAEALIIGVVASVAGLFAGLGISRLMGALFDAAGMGIPRGDAELAPRTIAISLGVGIGVTLLSALGPALRATRVTPLAAMHEEGAVGGPGRRRTVLSILVTGAGVALIASGLFGGGAASSRLAAMGAGTLAIFIGVALTARVLVRPMATVIGWPLERLSPTTGQLARENAATNAGRTATTAAALMVGLGLVVFVAVFAHGMKTSFTGSVRTLFTADLIVTNDNFSPVSTELSQRLGRVDGVRATAEQYFDEVRVNGDPRNGLTDTMNGTDGGRLALMYDADWIEGDDRLLARLGPGTTLVEEQFARAHDVDVGSSFAITTPSGGRARLRVLGIYRDPQMLTGFLVDTGTFLAASATTDPFGVYVRYDAGADPDRVRDRVELALDDFPSAVERTTGEYADYIGTQFDRIVFLLYALLAMSVVIAAFGIANNLFLAVFERTRELGVLRAIGATGEQVRRLVRYESLITSVIGGTLGIVIGVAFAYLTTLALDDWGLSFAVPGAQLAVFLVLAVVVGILGAVAPARRAARVDIVEAVTGEG